MPPHPKAAASLILILIPESLLGGTPSPLPSVVLHSADKVIDLRSASHLLGPPWSNCAKQRKQNQEPLDKWI
ncbi:hypothetical protein V8C34DRAFT_288242 [Trichoderma compactum]